MSESEQNEQHGAENAQCEAGRFPVCFHLPFRIEFVGTDNLVWGE
ncbi:MULTISPECIES: hypothetical protein [Rhizobium]|nr:MULTISPECIES: hypothetical protein [Rhizobium]MDE8763069.1 hypothetical protein [Rhizobium sp. CBK13]